jgi:hypothetical protein
MPLLPNKGTAATAQEGHMQLQASCCAPTACYAERLRCVLCEPHYFALDAWVGGQGVNFLQQTTSQVTTRHGSLGSA